MRSASPLALALGLALGVCGGGCDPAAGVEDGLDDTFLAAGKADAFGVTESSADGCRVRKLVNEATVELLKDEVGLSQKVARAIAKVRDGADAERGTSDDGWFATLVSLDKVPNVGATVFKKLLDFARAHDAYTCGEVPVQVLAFGDFHGSLEPPAGASGRVFTEGAPVNAGGVEYLGTHVARARAREANTMLVAAGDLIGGSPLLSAALHDEPTIKAMNLLGLDLSVVGNHEFDEGRTELRRMQQGGCHPQDGCQGETTFAGASFTYLGANVLVTQTGARLLPPYAIRSFGNARVAFLGLTLRSTPWSTTAIGAKGLRFLDEVETANALVTELKEQGIHAIVALIHQGSISTGLYNECGDASGPISELIPELDPAIEVIIGGHTHGAFVCEIDGRLVTHAGSNGRLLTEIHLTLDELTGAIASRTASNLIVTRTVPKDRAQSALLTKTRAWVNPIANRVVGTIDDDLTRVQNAAGESVIGNVVVDGQLAASQEQGAVIAVTNATGLRGDILRAQRSGGEAVGEVTYGEAFAVQPFGNTLITVTITGAKLKDLLERQWSVKAGVETASMLAVSAGFTYTWDAAKPVGSRVDPALMKLDGTVVKSTGTYRVVASQFLAEGAILEDGTDRQSGTTEIDALVSHLGSSTPFETPTTDRIVRLH